MLEIIKAKLINRHSNNILARSLESKKSIDWPKILLAIIVMFELLPCSIEYLFLPIEKAAATIHILSLQSTYKNSILHFKAVKVMIDIPGFAEVILNIIVCYHCFPGMVITNSGSFSFSKT